MFEISTRFLCSQRCSRKNDWLKIGDKSKAIIYICSSYRKDETSNDLVIVNGKISSLRNNEGLRDSLYLRGCRIGFTRTLLTQCFCTLIFTSFEFKSSDCLFIKVDGEGKQLCDFSQSSRLQTLMSSRFRN